MFGKPFLFWYTGMGNWGIGELGNWGMGGEYLGPQTSNWCPTSHRFFFGGEGSPTKLDYRQRGTFILTSLLDRCSAEKVLHRPYIRIFFAEGDEGCAGRYRAGGYSTRAYTQAMDPLPDSTSIRCQLKRAARYATELGPRPTPG